MQAEDVNENSFSDILHKISVLSESLEDFEIMFCEEYLKNLSATAAMIVINADPNTLDPKEKAQSILSNPAVREYLDLRRQQLREVMITKDDILLKAYHMYDKCMGPVAVIDKKGHPTSQSTFDSKGASKVLELMFKYFGMGDKVDNTNKPTIVQNLSVKPEDMDKFEKMFKDDY